jgi:hypothetical protein
MREKGLLWIFSSGMVLWAGYATMTSSQERSSYGMEIVRDRQPRALIVTPDDPLPVVQRAAEELQYHVRKSTGANLAIVPESQAAAPPPPAGAFPGRIYLGNCHATRAAGLDPQGIPPTGFVIRLIGNDLFLAGHDRDGGIPLCGL